ncbi:MAG: FAD-binding oxidoreductase [Burkholderiaceae bacterium]|nr:FAD-binding oxidoreductase [Burkholderiaceae bacterium]
MNSPIDPKYLSDWSGLVRGTPAELHRPRDTAEVAELVRRCNDERRKITVQGGLTGLAGGAVPADGDVVLNLERMNAIELIDELEGIMIVQAGATLEQVQAQADRVGWYFPVDLGARGTCQVGGNAATNAGGDRVLRYGTMRDSVLGLEAVLPDGSVLDSTTRLVKNSSGLDLRFLFIGSEGTLGVITRLVLKLQPMPGPAVTSLVALPDLPSVAKLLRELKRTMGALLSAYEFMSKQFIDQAVTLCGLRCPVDASAPWFVLMEARGAAGQQVEDAVQGALEQALEAGLINDCAVAASLADGEDFWRIRQSIPELLTHLKPTINFDVGLPWSQTTGFIERVGASLEARYPQAQHLFFGHLGDNNIHLMTGPHAPQEHNAVENIVYAELAGRHGTVSAEHGIGFIKKPYLHHTRSPSEVALLKRLKDVLDPRQTLNPGRVID